VKDPEDDKQKPETDVDSLIRLALWARNNRFLIADVTIGSLKLKIRDLQIDQLEEMKRAYSEPASIWEDAGMEGPLPSGDGTVG